MWVCQRLSKILRYPQLQSWKGKWWCTGLQINHPIVRVPNKEPPPLGVFDCVCLPKKCTLSLLLCNARNQIINLPRGDNTCSPLIVILEWIMLGLPHFCTYRMHVTRLNYNHWFDYMFIGDPFRCVRYFGPLLSVHVVEVTSPISVGFILSMLYLCFGWSYHIRIHHMCMVLYYMIVI